jgi:hypothetical protein
MRQAIRKFRMNGSFSIDPYEHTGDASMPGCGSG